MPPLGAQRISRVQFLLRARENGSIGIEVNNVGRCALLHNGNKVSSALVQPGDTLQLANEVLFLCVDGAASTMSVASSTRSDARPFGEADDDGIVGESAAMSKLREEVAFLAPRAEHALILGASGTGKELVARALHRRSPRGARPLVSRNAATLPEGLIAAELYGNVKNFPNPGMSDRIGLIGEADGSTLFLDEFAELPASMQAQLLRVLDQGEYQRIGETQTRRSDFRLIAATNRPIGALRSDVAARLTFRIEVPGLNARREDIPLLVRHLLRTIANDDPTVIERAFGSGESEGLQAIPCSFMRHVVQHHYVTNVRELKVRLWQALISKATGSSLIDGFRRSPPDDIPEWPAFRRSSPPAARRKGAADRPRNAPQARPRNPSTPGPAEIQACLDRHNGVQELAWRELGLSSRHALARLIAKHGLEVRRRSFRPGDDSPRRK